MPYGNLIWDVIRSNFSLVSYFLIHVVLDDEDTLTKEAFLNGFVTVVMGKGVKIIASDLSVCLNTSLGENDTYYITTGTVSGGEVWLNLDLNLHPHLSISS